MRAVAYNRLSREDMRGSGSTDEKFASRAQICRDIAARYDIDLEESDIFYEVGTGTKLTTRPVMRNVLEMCRTRAVGIVIAPYQDRVLRGDKRDEQDIEDTFIRGRIRLLTTEGEIDFGDEDYDPSLWEFRAMAGRAEVRRYSKRRRETHRANARLGRRDQGFAPYGYVWIPTLSDPITREFRERGHYEVIPDEYVVVEELFRRAFAESVYSITRLLNQRLRESGKPLPPGHRRRPQAAASQWRPSTLERILKNPFYAGYPCQRSRIIHGERRWLPESEWVMPESEQDYPHPISLAQHYQLRRILSERQRPGAPNTDSEWPLTGILRCGQGAPMHAGGRHTYNCSCRQQGREHPGMYVSKANIESVAVAVMARAVAALPADALPTPETARNSETRYRDARQQLNRVRQRLLDLEENFALLIRSWGRERYEESYADARRDLEAAEKQLTAVESEISEPAPEVSRTLIERVRRIGVDVIWREADARQRRLILGVFLRSLTLEAPARSRMWVRWCRAEVHGFIRPYYRSGRVRIPHEPNLADS